MSLLFRILAVFGLIALMAPAASATTIIARSEAELVGLSDAVVVAKVVAVAVEMTPDGPQTRNTLQVSQWWSGDGPERIDVLQWGGAWDNKMYRIPGDLELEVGDRVVAFLKHDKGLYFSTLFGWSVFDVAGTGADATVQRHDDHFGLMRRNKEGVIAPVDPALILPPKTLSELKRRVDAATGGAQ